MAIDPMAQRLLFDIPTLVVNAGSLLGAVSLRSLDKEKQASIYSSHRYQPTICKVPYRCISLLTTVSECPNAR